MPMQPQVLIVGAGPTGLTLALALLKNGIPVRVIDKVQEYHRSSRGNGVQPRIQEIHHFLGTLPDLQAVSTDAGVVLEYDPEDPYKVKRTVKIIESVDPTPQFPITASIAVNQYLHEDILRSHVQAHGGVVELGSELSGLEQDAKSVTVQLKKDIDGKETQETAVFPYVVGADGGHSIVRKLLGLQFIGETHEQEKLITADVDLKGFENHGIHIFQTESLFVAFRSTNIPERFQVVITGHGYAEMSEECYNAGVEEFQGILRRLVNRPDIEILKIHAKQEWKHNRRMVDHFRKGRVFVAGDAAHAHSPAGGQGLTSGVQDAFNLAWKLALVLKGFASPSLLETYEEERLPCIADMLLESARLHKLAFGENEAGKGADNDKEQDGQKVAKLDKAINALGSAAAPLAASSDTPSAVSSGTKEGDKHVPDSAQRFFRSRKLFQLDLNYRWSSIIFDERFATSKSISESEGTKTKDAYGKAGHDLRAGDRAPDAPGLTVVKRRDKGGAPVGKVGYEQGDVIRLFDVFDPLVHTVLIFPPASEEDQAEDLLRRVQSAIGKAPEGLVRTLVVLPRGFSKAKENFDADLVVDDKESHAHQGYGIDASKNTGAAVIIRPDMMIGAFVTNPTGAARYFEKVFTLM